MSYGLRPTVDELNSSTVAKPSLTWRSVTDKLITKTMTKKEKEQLKNQTSESLTKLVAKSRDTLWTLQTDLAAGKVKNVREIRKLKRLIAQSLTLMGQISI